MSKVLLRYFHYVRPESQASASLEKLIRNALATQVNGAKLLDSWKLREWTDTDFSPPKVMLANHLRPSQHNFFGDLLVMRPNQIDRILDTTVPNVREATARVQPASNAAVLIRSSMFWLIDEDHVVICSSGLQSAAFEKYMTWLLQTHAALGKAVVDLEQTVDVTAEDLKSIKEIELGDHLIVHPGPKAEKRARLKKTDVESVSGVQRVGMLRKALMAFYGNAPEADKLLDGIPTDQEVGWKFSLSYRRAKPEVSRRALEDAYKLMHERDDGSDVTLHTRQGKVKGDSLLLQKEAEVDQQSDGMINRDQLLGRMQEALQEWKSEGRIDG